MSEIRVNNLKNEAGTGSPTFPNGAIITGVATATTFDGNATGLSGTPDITVRNVTGVAATFTGVLTYEDVTNVDALGIITARNGIDVTGIITARPGSAVTFRGGVDVKDASETVSVGATSNHVVTKSVVLELDCSNGTVFTHNLNDGNVGIVSIKNFPVTKNSFHTVTVLFTQTTSSITNGIGNTSVTPANSNPGGIGTNITLTPDGVSGFNTNGLVGSATTVVLSTTTEDIDVVTFGIHYNGNGTGTAANYKTLVTKNGDFRYGTIGF
jgi:hypothetical protein